MNPFLIKKGSDKTGYDYGGYQTLKSLPGNNLEELTWSQK